MIRAFSIGLAFAAALASGVDAGTLRVRTSLSMSGGWSDATGFGTSLGLQNRFNKDASLRLMWEHASGPFRFEVHSQTNATQGHNLPFAIGALGVVPAPVPATLFDLSQNWYLDSNTSITNTIDRLNVQWSSANVVVKLGRQAITWGNGLFFHPTDIVAPFAPNAIDTAYKAGADMVYAQYLFDSGADVQAIYVPRGTTLGGAVMFDSSTYALRGKVTMGSLDTALMLARDRGDSVAGLSLSGALGGASWNAEALHWALADGTRVPSWLFNISNFGTLGDWNVSYFGEIYHNGFGADASVEYSALPAALTKRMSTGQVFFPGRDFLALGAQLQVSADLSFAPSAIVSLNDRSTLGTMTMNYTLGDNTNLVLNVSSPFGADGTEFGVRETAVGSGIFLGPDRSMTLQLIHFF